MKKNNKNIKPTSRRKFIKTLSSATVSAALLGTISCKTGSENTNNNNPEPALAPRTRKANPFISNEGKPILVSVKGMDFAQMLAAGLSLLGGLDRLIDNNQDVMVNPNFNHTDPFPGVTSVTSLTSIVEAVKQVSSGIVSVGDMGWEHSSSVYSNLSVEAAVTNAGGSLLTLSDPYRVRHSSWETNKPDFYVFQQIYDTPILLSTCVLKRHSNARLTCAIKNNVGTIAGNDMSSSRQYLHNSNNFQAELAEIAALVNPELVIVDARSILTVNGPRLLDGGTVVDVGEVIICGDIVAADAYCAQIMEAYDPGFSASMISTTLQRAVDLDLGTSDLSEVEILTVNV